MNTENVQSVETPVVETPVVANQSPETQSASQSVQTASASQTASQTEKKRAEVIPATEFIQTWLACYKAGESMTDFCKKTGISTQNAKTRFENYRDRIRSERNMELPELPKRGRTLNMEDIDNVLKSSGVTLSPTNGVAAQKPKKAKKAKSETVAH